MLQYSRTPCRYQVSLQVSIFSSCDIYTTSSKLMYLLWLQNIPIHPNTLSTPFTFKIPDCDESKIVRKKVSNYIFMAGWILHASHTACTYVDIIAISTLYLASISSSSSANPFQRNSYKIGFTVLWFNYV